MLPSANQIQSEEWEIDGRQIKLIRRLGTGRFSEVWEGLWNGTISVAVKTLKPGTQSFLAQAHIMMKIHHEKLLQLYALVTKEERFYIITEVMKHGNLQEYLENGEGRSLKAPELVDIGAQVAHGMSYLEEAGYIHTDLQARQILVGDGMICKISGFHSVFLPNDEDEYNPAEGFKFPIKWAAPEAAFYYRFSIKSSVWSFGILLCEIIAHGHLPYPGMTNEEVLEKIKIGYRMPLPPGCPDQLYNIMLDCWRQEPSERPTFESLQFNLEDLFTTDSHGYEIVK